MASTTATTAKATHYAASRLLEQAAMGPSPEAVARVRALGIEGWVDEQLKTPASLIVTPDAMAEYNMQDQVAQDRAWRFHRASVMNAFVGGQDQLRLKTSWALSNFLVVSTRKIQPYGGSEYFNTLQKGAFGAYGDLLKAITLSPAMGFYLDNTQNNRGNLNENYGRELLQLFSVGLVQLNLDGTPKRDVNGKTIETYSQFDVIETTKALTGWQMAQREKRFENDANWANYGVPLEARWIDGHDTAEKTVLGKKIPAGQDAAKDLDSLVQILVEHPNTAPFVSIRLIQNMTTSDPSPQYVQRVATVFQKTRGDLAQVVRAIVTDAEARRGDAPNRSVAGFGRIKEPLLVHVSIQRGLSCKFAVTSLSGRDRTEDVWMSNQQPLNAYSVFNFFPPHHRAPGSNLLSPEQKTLTANEFSWRMGAYQGMMTSDNQGFWTTAGCDTGGLIAAAKRSDDDLLDYLSLRYFRGAMPAAARSALKQSASESWLRDSPMHIAGAMLDMATLTPAMGVSR